MPSRRAVTLSVAGRKKNSPFGQLEPYVSSYVSTEESISSAAYFGPYNLGGGWIMNRHAVSGSPGFFKDDGFIGTYVPNASVNGETAYTLKPSSLGTLWTQSTTAIARVEPTKSNVDASVALGELLNDGIPDLPGPSMRERTRLARQAGKDYLNVEFGWLPLLSDLEKFVKAVGKSHSLAKQYRNGANRKQRRRFDFPSTRVYHSKACTDIVCNPSKNTFAKGYLNVEFIQDTWFVGNFVYHLPMGDDTYSRITRFKSYANKLYGVRMTPEVLWNLAPWSWALDWFGTIGDVVHNSSALANDGLVMQGAWIMQHTSTRRNLSATFPLNGSKSTSTESAIQILDETKTRNPGTPYGFGKSFSSLSATQTAVLAAVGLSHQRGF